MRVPFTKLFTPLQLLKWCYGTEALIIDMTGEFLGLLCLDAAPVDTSAMLQLLNQYPTSITALTSDRLNQNMANAALAQMEAFFSVEQYPDLAPDKVEVQREAFQQLFKFCDSTFTLLTI